MKRFRSITVKLLVLIISAFTLTTAGILFVAYNQLTQIIDRSQTAIYKEKVNVIRKELSRTNDRLKKTGLEEVYSDDFKRSAVMNLKNSYYHRIDMLIYPFIVDQEARIVMHPALMAGDLSFQKTDWIDNLLSSENGDCLTTYGNRTYWCIYQQFKPWNWVIGYMLPLDLKYKDARALYKTLAVIMVSITILVLVVLSLILTQFTKPIVRLTQISTQIASGNLDQPIDQDRADEIGTLAKSFSRMRDAIRCQIDELSSEINERKQAEKELEKARRYISNIIDSMPSVLVGIDLESRITQWNRAAVSYCGISQDKAVGMHLKDALPHLKDELEKIDDAIKTGQEQKVLKRVRMIGNDRRYENVVIYPLVGSAAEGVVIRVDDVTEQVRLEEMMVQSEKMLSVGGLAAGMAHEINNPLAGMIQNASVMGNRLTNLHLPANRDSAEKAGVTLEGIRLFMEDRNIPRMLTAIQEAGLRAAGIVGNMLNFAQKSKAGFSEIALSDVMDKTLVLAATDYDLKQNYDFKTIRIKKEYRENVPRIYCEVPGIQQVLLNILRNGAQAMQTLQGSRDYPGPEFVLRISVEQGAGMVRIEIEDNGPGMEESLCRRVFEPFFTTKPVGVGTGLGLSVSYFIITENHNGTMGVESELGEGTTFTIRLPLKQNRIPPS